MAEPDPGSAGDRAKASRLRRQKRAGTIGAADLIWYDQYEATREKKHRERVRAADVGASQSKRRGVESVEFRMHREGEEESQAVGSGAAASVAAGALTAREEGRRLDSLLQVATDAVAEGRSELLAAVKVYKSVCTSLQARYEILEKTHVDMFESMRKAMLARTEAEIEAMKSAAAEDDDKPAEEMFERILQRYFDGRVRSDGDSPPATTRGRPANGH